MSHTIKIVTAILFFPLFLTISSFALAQESKHDDFLYVPSKDSFDDHDRSFVFTVSSVDSRRSAALTWKCLGDGLNVIYFHNTYLGGDRDNEVRVRYRIDDRNPYGPSYWSLAQNKKASFMPMSEVRRFTNDAKAGGKVIFEVIDPLDDDRYRDTFSLRGLSAALNKLSCAK